MARRVFVINAHETHGDAAKGMLNHTLAEAIGSHLEGEGFEVRQTAVQQGWVVAEELEKWRWATHVFIQSPVYWWNVSAVFKRYQDEVFTSGMSGALCHGDGLTPDSPDFDKYGSAGSLSGKYMLSLTAGVPEPVFNRASNPLTEGRGVDDYFVSLHTAMRFFGLKPLPTFAVYRVVPGAPIPVEGAVQRLKAHLDTHVL